MRESFLQGHLPPHPRSFYAYFHQEILMNVERYRRGAGGWLALAIVCVSFVMLATFRVMRLRQPHSVMIKIDSNGTTRLGPLSLRNTNVRDAAFTVVGHLNSGTVSVSAANSAKFQDVVSTFDAMKQADGKR